VIPGALERIDHRVLGVSAHPVGAHDMAGAHEVEDHFFAIDVGLESGRIVGQDLGELLRAHLGKDEVRHFAGLDDAFPRVFGNAVADLRAP
jgi:hypothetical protein